MDMTTRLLKIFVVISFALLFTFFLFNNLTNFEASKEDVRSVLTMDGVLSKHLIAWRAVSNEKYASWALYFIMFWQFLTAYLLWSGVLAMMKTLRAGYGAFSRSKALALAGLTAGFAFFMWGFVLIGSEWFFMWQSVWSNLQLKALAFSILQIVALIYISAKE